MKYLALLFLALPLCAQHTGNRLEKWDKMRVIPAQITHIDPKSFEAVSQDRFETRVLTYTYDSASELPKPFNMTTLKGKQILILYCGEDLYAFAVALPKK